MRVFEAMFLYRSFVVLALTVVLSVNGSAQEVVRGKAPQPTSVPAIMMMRDVPLPPLDGILSKAKNNPCIYGIYTWSGEYLKHRQDLKHVGWKSIRLGGPIGGEIVNALVEDDIQVVHTVYTQAKKDANPADDQAFIAGYLKEQAEEVQKWAPRFKPHHFYIECWNEPNFQYLITPDKRPPAEQVADREALYAKLLVAAHHQLEGTGIPLVGFGAGGAAAADVAFIDKVHQADPAVARSYDILSTHPYSMFPDAYENAPWGPWTAATSFKAIREIMAANGTSDKPVWYTEVGWQITQEEGGRYKIAEDPLTAERRRVTTLQMQAAYTCRLYAMAQRFGVERVTNMFMTDTDNYNGGFFANDGSWRPVAHAVQTMIRLMPAPKLVEAISDGKDGAYAYRFQPSENAASSVLMLWNAHGVKTVAVPVTGSHVKFVDMLGHEQDVVPSNGKVSVETGPVPVYLVVDPS